MKQFIKVQIFAFLFYAALVFSGAGTFFWLEGWLFLFAMLSMWLLIFKSLDGEKLIHESLKKIKSVESNSFFSSLSCLCLLSSFWLFINGVDTARYDLSDITTLQQIIGGTLFMVSLFVIYWSLKVDLMSKFSRRKKKLNKVMVAEYGPYVFIRHPMYCASCLMLPSASFMMGSVLGVLVSIFIIVYLLFHTHLEDQQLKKEFKQYHVYSEQVHYRLLPYIW